MKLVESHFKGFYKHPNICTNHQDDYFDHLRNVSDLFRNHPTAENYFLRLECRKIPLEMSTVRTHVWHIVAL